MKTLNITANFGNFDKPARPVEQSVEFDYSCITEKEFPLRHCAMTPRMQARLVKTHTWQFVPGYDIYLWVDSSCQLQHKDSVKWFLEMLGDNDIAVFVHPHRKTILDEAQYLQKRLEAKDRYITSRYENELIQEQLKAIKGYEGLRLYATTAMIYRRHRRITDTMINWWYHISRYHIIDQLSFPYWLKLSGCKVKEIEDNFMKIPYLTPIRP